MKILMLNYEFPPLGGGASPVSYEIAKGLAVKGHTVNVVTMGHKYLPDYEEVDGINVYRVKCLRSKKEICHPWEQLTYLISAYFFLKKHLKKNSYDINHTHFIIPTGVLSYWIKKKYGLSYIITSHGSDVLGYNKRFAKLYPFLIKPWKSIIKNALTVTTPSLFLQNEIKKITTDGVFQIIPNGIDAGKFKPMKKENRILIVARLFINKGVQDILDALKFITLDGWQVDVVGDGPYKEFLVNKCKKNNLEDKVIFHGWVDNKSQEMKDFYGKSSIFISASYFESFGLTVLEAMQAGCRCLVSDIDGYKQLDMPEDCYFRSKNIEDLKSKIKSFLFYDDFSKHVTFSEKYEWKNIIMNYEKLLKP